MFLPLYGALPWRVDPLAVLAGLAIRALWTLTAPPPLAADDALAAWLAALPGGLAALWVATRILGAAVVPVIEELAFRGYVLQRADFDGLAGRLVAVALSTALFAALHDRWLPAALAGLVFAALTLRSGRLTDAILADAAANAIIAAAAIATGDWSRI
jgi:exosortase E/protease (VPEID-CTERM system)